MSDKMHRYLDIVMKDPAVEPPLDSQAAGRL